MRASTWASVVAGQIKHHVVERRDDHAAIEKIMMDGQVDRAMDDAARLAAIARALRAAHELDPRADAHDMPGRPMFDDDIARSPSQAARASVSKGAKASSVK